MNHCKNCYQPCDGSRCDFCRRKHNKAEAARRDERRGKRLCWVCGTKAAKDLRTCEAHRGTAWRTG